MKLSHKFQLLRSFERFHYFLRQNELAHSQCNKLPALLELCFVRLFLVCSTKREIKKREAKINKMSVITLKRRNRQHLVV